MTKPSTRAAPPWRAPPAHSWCRHRYLINIQRGPEPPRGKSSGENLSMAAERRGCGSHNSNQAATGRAPLRELAFHMGHPMQPHQRPDHCLLPQMGQRLTPVSALFLLLWDDDIRSQITTAPASLCFIFNNAAIDPQALGRKASIEIQDHVALRGSYSVLSSSNCTSRSSNSVLVISFF